jgi:hypothetical protein
MTAKKVTELPLASSVTTDDLIPVVDGTATTQKATIAQVLSAGLITSNGSVSQEAAEVTTTNTDATTIGTTFPIPTDSIVVVDVQCEAIFSGATKSKTFSVRRLLHNNDGVVTAPAQINTIDPVEIGGVSSVTVSITFTGTTGRVEVVGSADVRFRVDRQIVRLTAATFVGSAPSLASVTPDLSDPAGGTSHVLAGTGFTGTSSVSVGGTNVPTFAVDSDSQITFTMPARAIGANLSVVVTNPSGSNGANTLFEVWGPEAEACSLLFDKEKGAYTFASWPGVASAGASGGRNLTGAGNSPQVASGEPDFVPTDLLSGTATMAQIFTAAAGSIFVIFDADTAAAPVGPIDDPGIFIDQSTYMGLTFATNGVTGWLLDGSRKTITLAAATGQRHAAMFRWGTGGGGQLELKVDGNTATPVACGDMDSTAGQPTVGVNYTQTAPYDGRIRTIMCLQSTASDALYTKFRKWAQVARGAL